ncbi:MAG TPA: type II secretion system protein [Candidatus Ozemobacteraceae bacterium]|nr:type II secretion system protein [Candidatus Ozemobacteraceae bacterium]
MNLNRRGFNLVEMLIVVAVLSFLTVLALPLTEITYHRAGERRLRERLGEIRQAIDAYRRSHRLGQLPASIASLTAPIAASDLRVGANEGPFLAYGSLGNPFTSPPDTFHWELRLFNPSAPSHNTWQIVINNASTTFGTGTGVFDIRFPLAGVNGLATSPLDGTVYGTW